MIPLTVFQSELYGGRVALKILWRALEPQNTLRVLADVADARANGEPWRGLGRPADEKEALSRRQIGGPVLLERALRKVADPDTARSLVSEIVLAASVDFLKRNVPVMRKRKILRLAPARRDRYLSGIQAKFFNADADMRLEDDQKLCMTVRRCRFVELLDAIGERAMAPVFCEGDRVFFDKHQPGITLKRPKTLSHGGDVCDFQFSWVK